MKKWLKSHKKQGKSMKMDGLETIFKNVKDIQRQKIK